MAKEEKTIFAKGRDWTPSLVKELIKHNDAAAKRALLKIYDNQDPEEKASQQTIALNGIGFNGVDARILSSFAQHLKQKGFLSPKQMAIVKKKMPKYTRQVWQMMEKDWEAQLQEYDLID
jgi:hypothetical protein